MNLKKRLLIFFEKIISLKDFKVKELTSFNINGFYSGIFLFKIRKAYMRWKYGIDIIF